MSKFNMGAVFGAAVLFFSVAGLTAAPGLAEGLSAAAVQPVATSTESDIRVLKIDSAVFSQDNSDVLSRSRIGDNAVASSLSDLVRQLATNQTADADQECLAGAVYFESKGEPLEGQHAVAEVIINRTKSGLFPKSFCSVVFQRGQFAFAHGKSMGSIPRESAAWRNAVAIALIATENRWKDVVPNALYFHARRVSPNWDRSKIASVGNHIFYR